jgi:polysaccharide biosynthesis protein PslH
MANILLLTHRIPFPPDKGDKIHTYHLLRHLGQKHRLMVGTFVDDAKDEQHVPTVRGMCSELYAARLYPLMARLRGVTGLLREEPLTVAYYRDAGLARWVSTQAANDGVDAVIVHSSSMLQYAELVQAPLIADLNDVDSVKWADYGETHAWPMSWVYRREAAHLLKAERRGAQRARMSLFATEREVDLFKSLAPESANRVFVLGNGVDTHYFSPQAGSPSPYATGELPIVFVGTMDYWPNVDAVTWFAQSILPGLRQRWPNARFHIVGRNPTAAVRALASESVHVAGTVPDTRPWLQHAAAVVAPLRVARGILNKVLEAMAMARPVVATPACADSLRATHDQHLCVAANEAEFVQQLDGVLSNALRADRLAAAAREFVCSAYSWDERMATLDGYLADAMRAATGSNTQAAAGRAGAKPAVHLKATP